MPTEYTLTDLARLAEVTPRTVRYYIAQGLLPPPTQAGPAARYTEAHLERLRLIKKLQAGHLPLAEIRTHLRVLPDDQIATMAEATVAEPGAGSAIDYVRRVLGGEPRPSTYYSLAAAPPPPPAPAPTPAPHEHDRSQWDRISLNPDVELHVRRPLGRLKNRRVDRLIAIARQLLEEE